MDHALTATQPLPADTPSGPSTIEWAFASVDSLEAAEGYTRRLACGHYENFSVVSLLLPKRLRQDFSNVYAFCRTADDMADEVGDSHRALALLARFREDTLACYRGQPRSAIFMALQRTIDRYDIPPEPFLDLIDAFEQDQRVGRYQSFEQLRDYCRRSADPVGRLVLYICGCRDAHRQELSDATCTALQLANFWQDVRPDLLQRDRIYIPLESMDRFGVTEANLRDDIASGRAGENFRRLMQFEVDRTASLFDQGDRLPPLLDRSVRRQVQLFSKGGRAVLAAIRRRGYDTLSGRPRLGTLTKARLILSTLAASLASRLGCGGRA